MIPRTIHQTGRKAARAAGLATLMLTATALGSPVFAQSASTRATIQALQSQLQNLQAEIDALKAQENQTQTEVVQTQQQVRTAPPPAAVASAAPMPGTAGYSAKVAGVKITPGGFIEAAEIYRSRNETTGIGSNFNTGIPLPNSTNYRTGEFRSSAQQSRISLLAQGTVNENLKLTGYYESDFISAAPTANSNESNSYNLRMRLAFAQADMPLSGLHFLAGQAWSMATMFKSGLTPRQEDTPLQIDAQYVVGFNWARQMTLRGVMDFGPMAHLGLSIEEPQQVYTGTVPSGTVVNNTGVSQLDPSATYSTDVAPDVIAKFAVDPGWGHYEVYGLARWFHDQTGLVTGTSGNGGNDTKLGGGIGAGVILPLLPKLVDFRISGLVGDGIGRYGSASLPDVTVTATGAPKPIHEVEALVGLEAHPGPVDLYAYAGLEEERRTAVSTVGTALYGYGNPGVNNTGCWVIGGTCGAQTSAVREWTVGGWYKFYKGSYGTVEFGVQDAELYRDTFGAKGGAPSTNDNVLMTSFRYYPFQ